MNTARMARRFHERGIDKGHADAIAEVLGEEVEAGLVTDAKLDARLSELETRLLGRIGEVETRLGDKITNLVKWFAGIAIVQTATIIGAVRLLFIN